MKKLLILTGCLHLAILANAQAQSADRLKADFERESRLLDEAITKYGVSRARETAAVNELRGLSDQLDEAVEDPNASLDYLVGLETEMAAARDRACASLESTSVARRRMYEHMERLATVAREFERQTRLFGTAQVGLTGMWHLELEPLGVNGLINLRLSGSQVSGPYRLSNGNQGSVRGSLSGDRLELQAIDAQRGVVANIEARVDATAGEIRGLWTTLELAAGLPSTGDWLATRVSSQEEIDLDY